MANTTGPTVTVDGQALRQVLVALVGQPHHIRELQATRSLHKLGYPNPIDILIEQFNAAVEPQPPQPSPVQDYPPLPDFDTVEQHIYGACRRYITQDMLEPIHNLIRETVDADRAARDPADSVLAEAVLSMDAAINAARAAQEGK